MSYVCEPQVDAATVAAARNSQRNSSYIPHTLHSYQAATAAAAASATSVGAAGEQMDASASVAAAAQPSVMVACRESCRRCVVAFTRHDN